MWWNYLSIPKLQRGNRWSLGMDKSFNPTFPWACDYLSMLGLKFDHVSKRSYWHSVYYVGGKPRQYWCLIDDWQNPLDVFVGLPPAWMDATLKIQMTDVFQLLRKSVWHAVLANSSFLHLNIGDINNISYIWAKHISWYWYISLTYYSI